MSEVKRFPSSVALLADQVGSRQRDRAESHAAILEAILATTTDTRALDPLRVTVGDELQGVYATLGEALAASYALRLRLAGRVDLRIGLGGGTVEIIDPERGIQDGSAWWNARAAIESVERAAAEPALRGIRTAIVDERTAARSDPLAEATTRLVDAHLARLRPGATQALVSLLAGESNRESAERAGISPSANSQRVVNNDLRVLAETIQALGTLP